MDLRKEDANPEDRIPDIVRTARFVQTDEGWFFRTREGIMLGPYADQFDAELSASLLVAQLAQADPGTDTAALIQRFMTDPANATITQLTCREPQDLAAIRRRARRANSQVPSFQKAWDAIVRIAATPKKIAPPQNRLS